MVNMRRRAGKRGARRAGARGRASGAARKILMRNAERNAHAIELANRIRGIGGIGATARLERTEANE